MFEVPPLSEDISPEETRQVLVADDDHEAQDISTKFAPLTPSRALTIYDPSIDPAHTSLLQRVYLDPCDIISPFATDLRLIQILTSVYGPSIAHPNLRLAAILYCQPMWRETRKSVEEMEDQRRRTRHALSRKITKPEIIDEGDLLATFLIALHYLKSGCYAEGKRHVQGFCSLMKHLLINSRSRGEEFAFRSFLAITSISASFTWLPRSSIRRSRNTVQDIRWCTQSRTSRVYPRLRLSQSLLAPPASIRLVSDA